MVATTIRAKPKIVYPPEIKLCNCKECPLSGNQKVLGEGTDDKLVGRIVDRPMEKYHFVAKAWEEELVRNYESTYKVAVVAISPVDEELRRGRPMVGWSGRLIRESLRKVGVKRYYLTNALLCNYPEGMTNSKIMEAARCCRPRLLAELERLRVKLVIAFGNVPLEAITKTDYQITKIEGRIIPFGDFSILPISHPAGLRKSTSNFRDYIDLLRLGPRYLLGTYQQSQIPNVTVANAENLGEICRDIEAHGLVAVDLETTKNGFYPYGRDPDKIRCVVVATSDRDVYIIPGYSSPYYEEHPNFVQDPRLKKVLGEVDCITHNGPFDMGFLRQEGYDKVKIHFDTFLAHYMFDEREYSHGLKSLGHRYNGAPDWETGIKDFLPHKFSSYDLIPTEELYKYAAWDGTQTYQLSEGVGFRRKVPKVYWDLIVPCANMFTDIRHRGFRIDMDVLFAMDETLEQEYGAAVEELETLVGFPVNPLSALEMISLLYNHLKLPPYQRYGRTSSKKVLALYGNPICDSIKECREVAKFKSTYVIGMASFLDFDSRIHPFTKIHGAVTGRISTEDPSVMNITKRRGIKKLYLPEEGQILLEADQGQMEFRCYGVIGPDQHMKDLFLADRDPHMEVAHALALLRGLDWASMTDGEKRALRQRCKNGDFGRLYGRGLESFIYGYGLDREGAMAFVDTIDGVFPGIKAYNKQVKKEIHGQGYLESFFERRRRFGLLLDETKNEAYRQGANFKVQSMASDINLFGMLELWRQHEALGIFPMFPVHDSIIMSIPDISVIPEVKRIMEDTARDLVNGETKFVVDMNYGPSWGETIKWNAS